MGKAFEEQEIVYTRNEKGRRNLKGRIIAVNAKYIEVWFDRKDDLVRFEKETWPTLIRGKKKL